jgi:hypothetical protein
MTEGTEATNVVIDSTPRALPKPTTPDDLLSMYDAEEVASAPKEAPKEEVKETPVKPNPADELTTKGPTEGDRKTLAKNEEISEEKKEVPAAAKSFRANVNGEAIDLPEEAEFTQTINGKNVTFKAKDAIQAFTKQEEFNRNMDRRVQAAVAREKKAEGLEKKNQTDLSSIREKWNQIIEEGSKGGIFVALRAISNVLGLNNPVKIIQIERNLLDHIDKVGGVYSGMKPEEREVFWAERRAKILDETLKSRDEQDSQRESKGLLESKVKALQEEHKISPEEFWASYKYLAENAVGEGKPKASADDITPEDVVSYTAQVRHLSKVYEAAEKAKLTDEALIDTVADITQSRPDIGIDQIVKVIEDARKIAGQAPAQAVENLNRKAEKSNLKTQFKASSTQKVNGKIDGLDAEDLDFLYRQGPRPYGRIVR